MLPGQAVVPAEWARYLFFPEKRYEIINYIVSILCLFVYYAVAYLKVLNNKDSSGYSFANYLTKSKKLLFVYTVFIACANISVVLLYLAPSKLFFFNLILIWICVFCMPFYSAIYKYLNNALSKMKVVYYIFFFISITQFTLMFSPFIFEKLKIMNEFIEIPEETLIGKEYVKNNEFINFNNILIDHNKYDLETDRGNIPLPKKHTFVNVAKAKGLTNFIEKNKTKYYHNDKLKALENSPYWNRSFADIAGMILMKAVPKEIEKYKAK